MQKESKERLNLWLNYCKTFDIFERQYRKMISEMRLEDLSKFKRFEETQSEWSRKGTRKYTHFKIDDYSHYDQMKLIVGKNNLRYELSVVDKNLDDVNERVYGLNENRIDYDYVALLIIDDGQLQNHHMYEVDIVKTNKGYKLVCREWVNLKITNTKTKELTDQQIDALLGDNDIKLL